VTVLVENVATSQVCIFVFVHVTDYQSHAVRFELQCD